LNDGRVAKGLREALSGQTLMPPSTNSIEPVVKLFWSDAR